MPDVWTEHPELVRDLLRQGGFRCGVEPRVLKGRDPEWTCVVDGSDISGDLYVHHVESRGSWVPGALELVVLGVLLVIVLCQAWAIIRMKRKILPT